MAQMKHQQKWQVNHPDEFLQTVIDKFKKGVDDGEIEVAIDQESEGKVSVVEEEKAEVKARPRGIRYIDDELDGDAFTKLLGLPTIDVAKLFADNGDRDEIAEEIMAEHCHFVYRYEGYPDLMTIKESESPNQQVKMQSWLTRKKSHQLLDFYSDAVAPMTKLMATLS